MFYKSIDLANSNFFGVGLGNMFDYLPKKEISSIHLNKLISLAAMESGPHNIFFQFLAESGYAGLIIFILLLIYFVKDDLRTIKNVSDEKKVLVSMFWTLIFMTQFFPAINLTFYVLFFLIRGLIRVLR